MDKEELNLPRLLKEFDFEVERGKIAEFAMATGAQDIDVYMSKEAAIKAGYPDVPVPLTFGTVPEMWKGLDFEDIIADLDLTLTRVLHGSQSYTYHKSIFAGDHLFGKTYLVGTKQRKGLSIYSFETVFFNDKEELLLECKSVVIERGEGR
ncbi:FAS1-like dehydratase domain-containing protein [Alkalihalobacterium chitinilyticum]|uniref:MaoC family dehydratase N-terminal domain-containing protein n=1 Tax=Alkalihalobacterium chitinilyticum TaxID=2980103 RepID=A0ABT5VJJ6_9BACI|nr:MaoC family dehydratase N-terminal domain-containing protein [Alkalihalobacterium chitinilyticum]MDE5415628.1 MaoC family dehydratase N-terminal domain-containing protein [Alkalihalobacterium chitinilyticum]